MSLYDLNMDPRCRVWLHKLLYFIDNRCTPITHCPLINNTPLDLYKLYMNSGFLVCTCGKDWTKVATQLGIAPAVWNFYTLKKHNVMLLLPFNTHIKYSTNLLCISTTYIAHSQQVLLCSDHPEDIM